MRSIDSHSSAVPRYIRWIVTYQSFEYTSHNSGAVNCTAGHTLSSVAHDPLQSSRNAAPSEVDRLALARRRRLSKHVRDASKSTLGAYLV